MNKQHARVILSAPKLKNRLSPWQWLKSKVLRKKVAERNVAYTVSINRGR